MAETCLLVSEVFESRPQEHHLTCLWDAAMIWDNTKTMILLISGIHTAEAGNRGSRPSRAGMEGAIRVNTDCPALATNQLAG